MRLNRAQLAPGHVVGEVGAGVGTASSPRVLGSAVLALQVLEGGLVHPGGSREH